MSGEEKLHDREGVRTEDQQAVYERDQVASGGKGTGRDAVHRQGSADLLDDSAERRQEVQNSKAGQTFEAVCEEAYEVEVSEVEEINPQPHRAKKPRSARRAGQIEKRGDNKYLIRVFLGRDFTGKKRYHSETFEGTRKEAGARLRAKLNERDTGALVPSPNLTLNQYLDKWLEIAKNKVAERTYEDYAEILKRYVRPELGARKISSLKALDLQGLYARMLSRKLSSRTVRYVNTILSSSLKQAVKWGMLSLNPASGVELPRKERKEMRAMTPEEARKFLAVAKDERYGILFTFALETGMRPEEYLALMWSDLDLERGTVTVQRTLCWRRKGRREDGVGWYFGEPKTPRSRRSIPLSDSIIQNLLAHRPPDFDPEGFVFTSSQGSPLISDNLAQRHFKPLLKKAGLSPEIRLYDLRHTMATLLLLASVNPKIVSERLGHASVVLTLDTYSHILPGMQEQATRKLEVLLFSNEGDTGS